MVEWRSWASHVVVLPLAFLAFLYFKQDVLIYHPSGYGEKVTQRDFVMRESIKGQWLNYTTTLDGEQSCLLLSQEDAKVARVYLVFGGNAMRARDWLGILANQLASAKDVGFVLVDYPGYGFSQGAPSQASIGRSSLEAMEQASKVWGGELQFGALGHSIGCAAALQLATASRDNPSKALQHVILSAPFTTLASMAQAMFPFLKIVPTWLIAGLTASNEWDNLQAASQLAGESAPRVDIIHGTDDSIVPFDMGKELWQHLESLKAPVSFKSAAADHNDMLSTATFQQWLQKQLER